MEIRSIHKTNVLALSDEQIREFKKLLDGASNMNQLFAKLDVITHGHRHRARPHRRADSAGYARRTPRPHLD